MVLVPLLPILITGPEGGKSEKDAGEEFSRASGFFIIGEGGEDRCREILSFGLGEIGAGRGLCCCPDFSC